MGLTRSSIPKRVANSIWISRNYCECRTAFLCSPILFSLIVLESRIRLAAVVYEYENEKLRDLIVKAANSQPNVSQKPMFHMQVHQRVDYGLWIMHTYD